MGSSSSHCGASRFLWEFWTKGTHCAAFDELAVSGVDESDGVLSAKGHGEAIELENKLLSE
jgi:hypothetical protein